jgi:ribosomal protein S18 acetylase RimI-like enzyme
MPSTSAAPPGAVTLRPVTEQDREFLVGVYWSTRREELALVAWPDGEEEAFVRMQFDAQDVSYRTQNPLGSFDVVQVDGRPAGRLYVDRRPDDVRIVDISLLPEFRRRGVGTYLIGRLLQEAAASGRTASIHVEVHNPAAGLYVGLGFATIAERGVYRLMEWSPQRVLDPSAGQAKTAS